MTYRYGTDWNIRLHQPIDEIGEPAARERFQTGPQVSVSKVDAGAGAVPAYTLILGPGGSHVRVRLYDAQGSVVETYDYSQVEWEERLFLDTTSSGSTPTTPQARSGSRVPSRTRPGSSARTAPPPAGSA